MTTRDPSHAGILRTAVLTVLTMLAFAGNSLLCRAALAVPAIDPASFATIRTLAGAVVLWILAAVARPIAPREASGGNWASALALATYMVAFAFAYISLDAGTGALILFGAVQITMMTAALLAGERLRVLQWLGFVLAIAGLVWLMLPGVTKPSIVGALLMAIAGAGWGVYSLRGRGIRDPLRGTAANFVRAVPLVGLVSLIRAAAIDISAHGVVLAVVSGAVASGIGYTLWYAALRGLTATRAATVQLTVPVIAALGGVLLLEEQMTWRLATSGMLTLGGVALAIGGRSRGARRAT